MSESVTFRNANESVGLLGDSSATYSKWLKSC